MSSRKSAYDITIIGGGIMGSALAYWLAREGSASVVVIERDPTYATASSALSASSIRQQFSTPVCIAMSRFGFEFLKNIGNYLATDDTSPETGLVERGYLYLADDEGRRVLQDNIATQQSHGVSLLSLPQRSLAERYEWLETSDLTWGCLGLAGEGWFDGYSLLQAFRSKARSLGVVYRTDEAINLSRDGGNITGVDLAGGLRIETGIVVNAAGPRAAEVSRWAGFDLPVVPERRTVFVFACRTPPDDCPLVIDPSGLYFRPEGQFFIAGGPAGVCDSDPFDLSPDLFQFEDFIWPTLAHRVPAFESIKMLRAWAGHYEMNQFDHNALIGKVPDLNNLFVISGFSGHGMQHAAAAGRGLAELILHGGYRTLDLSPLSPARLLTGVRLAERNII